MPWLASQNSAHSPMGLPYSSPPGKVMDIQPMQMASLLAVNRE